VGEKEQERVILRDYPTRTGVPHMSKNEESLYYKKLVTKRDLQSLRQKLSYFGRRTADGYGVTGAFVKRLQKDVLVYLGGESFKYLKNKMDARNHVWELSASYSWNEIERLGMTRGYTRKVK
jgi:hypothetical protein